MVYWARAMAWITADLTRDGQARGNGIAGDDGLAGIGRLPEGFLDRLLEAYLKLLLFHELGRRQKESKLGGPAQRAAIQYRRDIAKLKRLVGQQEKEIKRIKKRLQQQQDQPQPTEDQLESVRFSARSVKAQRQRLGLSAADYGRLVGVSGLTIYNWEHDKARPRKAQLAALVAVRGIGKREALTKLTELGEARRRSRRRARR